MERSLTDEKAQLQMKVGDELTWVNGYKVFELKTSEGLDRFSDERRMMKILETASPTVFSNIALVLAFVSVIF